MKRNCLKIYYRKQEVFLWRITLVKRAFKKYYIRSLTDGPFIGPEVISCNVTTFLSFGRCVTDCLHHIAFDPKLWTVFSTEKLDEIEYKKVYQL